MSIGTAQAHSADHEPIARPFAAKHNDLTADPRPGFGRSVAVFELSRPGRSRGPRCGGGPDLRTWTDAGTDALQGRFFNIGIAFDDERLARAGPRSPSVADRPHGHQLLRTEPRLLMKVFEHRLAPVEVWLCPGGLAFRQQGLGAPAVVVGPQLRALPLLRLGGAPHPRPAAFAASCRRPFSQVRADAIDVGRCVEVDPNVSASRVVGRAKHLRTPPPQLAERGVRGSPPRARGHRRASSRCPSRV